MKRSIGRMVTYASLSAFVVVLGGGVALAQQAPATAPALAAQPHDGHGHGHGHEHRAGLIGAALKLDSLTTDQRTAIEQLESTRRSAETPVRQADAVVLTQLAQQVEQASIDPKALAPAEQARESAATAARSVDRDTLQKLHDTLTPAQRSQLVDAIEARFPQGAGGQAGQDGQPDAGAPGDGHGHHHGELGRLAHRLNLTPEQRQQIMAQLRAERASDGGAPGHAFTPGAGKAWLESFRGDAFSATGPAAGMAGHGGERMEKVLAAAVPVLTASQRATLASELRARAAHETSPRSHG